MSYTPTNWSSGDVITAEKLNNLESGVAESGTLIVEMTHTAPVWTMNKTWKEIKDALFEGIPVFVKDTVHNSNPSSGVYCSISVIVNNEDIEYPYYVVGYNAYDSDNKEYVFTMFGCIEETGYPQYSID